MSEDMPEITYKLMLGGQKILGKFYILHCGNCGYYPTPTDTLAKVHNLIKKHKRYHAIKAWSSEILR